MNDVQTNRRSELEFDTIVRLASDRFDVPIAVVDIAHGNELLHKARVGIDGHSVPRDVAFSTHILDTGMSLVVEDLSADPRFCHHPVVVGEQHVRFYAGVPLIDHAGVVNGTLCVMDQRPRLFTPRDLAALTLMGEQVQARIELAELRVRERGAAVIDHATSDAFIMCDDRGAILHWNPGAEKLLGWTREEALTLHAGALIPARVLAERGVRFLQLLADPDMISLPSMEVPVMRRDGSEVYVHQTIALHESREGRIIVSILRDVTARRAAEVAQAAQRAMIDAIIENTPAAMFARLSTTDEYLFVNRALETLLGRTRDELIGRSMKTVFGQDTETSTSTGVPATADDVPVTTEHTIVRPDGARRLVKVNKTRTVGPSGDYIILGFAEDVTDTRAAEQRLLFMANHDNLTGLLNRRHFMERLDAAAGQGDVAAIMVDLDRFKLVNDLHGHAAGDEVLIEVAKRLSQTSRCPVARLGGDEFAILVAQVDHADAIAHQCVQDLARPFAVHDHMVGLGGSAGVAVHRRDDPRDADLLLRNADLALYRAKHEGRNRTCLFHPDMNDAARERQYIETELREALDQNSLYVEYQPLAAAGDGRIVSYEALARWTHPVMGVIPPATFIPIAEECGLMSRLGRFVLLTAAREAASWDPELTVAVNLSPVQLEDGNIVAEIAQVLEEAGLAPSRLEIEITERLLIRDVDRGLSVLRALRALGVAIAMDDFGTGYSSLNYFRTFPFDKIKIDRSFICDMEENPQALAIVQALIGLGRGLGMPVVAEGVESAAQLASLRREGCDVVQGFHIGRPARIETLMPGRALAAAAA